MSGTVLGSTAVYWQHSNYPVNGGSLQYPQQIVNYTGATTGSPANQNIQGHWSGNISNNRYDVFPAGTYIIGDYWHKVVSVTDVGQWVIGTYTSTNSGYYNVCCCNDCNCAGFQGTSYICSPSNKGFGCYYENQYQYNGGCAFCFCCNFPHGFALQSCYTHWDRYYYDSWSANWRTTYNVYKYEYGGWTYISSYTNNTGGSPVFV